MQEIRNIPGVWTALAAWLSYIIFIYLLPKKRDNKAVNWIIVSIFLIVQIVYMRATERMSGLSFNLGMAGFAIVTLLPFLIIIRGSIVEKMYYCCRAFITGGFMASFGWQMYTMIYEMTGLGDITFLEITVMSLIYAGLFVLFMRFERHHKDLLQEMPISILTCVTTIAIAYAVYVLSSATYSDVRLPVSIVSAETVFVFRSILYLAGVAMLFAHHVQLCESYVSIEKEVLMNLLNMQYNNYQMNQESVDLINQKYHDLKHQIAILRTEIPKEQKTEYLDKMEYEIQMYESQNKTGNKYLDTILTGKNIRCIKEGVQMTCVADGKLLNFMDVMDMSVLFGNALDNAIEETGMLEKPEERLIHLSVSKDKCFVRVHIENRCQDNIEIKNKIPVTTKRDSRYHGFGIKSIKKTVEKYHGSLTIHAAAGWFELRMLFPLK